jgi:hypothetical protein
MNKQDHGRKKNRTMEEKTKQDKRNICHLLFLSISTSKTGHLSSTGITIIDKTTNRENEQRYPTISVN